MIYATGDLHGDIKRFKAKDLKKLKKNDTLFVCGDFGFLWNGAPEEERWIKWIGSRKFNTVFVEGCHDNLDLIERCPITDWNGGKVRVISGRLMHAVRGSVFQIEGRNIFTMGGAESADVDMGQSWWQRSMPTLEETKEADKLLEKYRYVVDYIITHDCPPSLLSCVGGDHSNYNYLLAFFDNLQKNARYKGWFFGRYHLDKTIPPFYRALYADVVPLQ